MSDMGRLYFLLSSLQRDPCLSFGNIGFLNGDARRAENGGTVHPLHFYRPALHVGFKWVK